MLAKFHDLQDVRVGTEVSLFLPNQGGRSREIGSRDIFLFGKRGDKNLGVTIELEKRFDRSSIRKLLYGFVSSVKLATGEEIDIKHHNIIITPYIVDHIRDKLRIDRARMGSIYGLFRIGEMIHKAKNDKELLNVIVERGMEVGSAGINKLISEIDKGNVKEETLNSVLSDILEKNKEEMEISFEVDEPLLKLARKNGRFLDKLGEYFAIRPFKNSVKAKASNLRESSELELKEVLDLLARDIRKSLQRTAMIVTNDMGNDIQYIVVFERVEEDGKKYALIPKIITPENMHTMMRDHVWKVQATKIDELIRAGKPIVLGTLKETRPEI